MQGYDLKVEWEAEPSAIKLLSCGTIFQSQYGRQTHTLSDFSLKPYIVIMLMVRAGLSLSYAAIGLSCWGNTP